MSDLQRELDSHRPVLQSEYDKTLEEVIQSKDHVLVTGSLALPLAPGDGIGKCTLPRLPKGVKWQLVPITADQRAKLGTTGTANDTIVQVATKEDPNTNLATATIANTDGDDTFVNMGSLARTLLPGGQELVFNVDAIATGAAGSIGLELMFRAVSDQDSTQIVDLQ